MLKALALTLIILIGGSESAAGQADPLPGTILLTVAEPVRQGAPPSMVLTLATPQGYPCNGYSIATRQRQQADTISITILGITSKQYCNPAVVPAYARMPLQLSPGKYTLTVTRGEETDRLELDVTASSLSVRPHGRLAFIRPDTTVFLRAAARSFLVSCGTPNVPELCGDLAAWLARQPGIVRRNLPAEGRFAFARGGNYWYMDYQLYEYANAEALEPIRSCMRFVADTLTESVGAGITLLTADGEFMGAGSGRSLDERHIAVARKVSGTRGCP